MNAFSSRTSAGKTRRGTTSGKGWGDSSAGERAAAIAPPRYGMDFIDGGLPHSVRAGVESPSGMDLSNVRFHANSSKPAQEPALEREAGRMGARALDPARTGGAMRAAKPRAAAAPSPVIQRDVGFE